MSSRGKQRCDRIRQEIPIIQVLSQYGYHVYADGGDREQQFSCDLHGDGRDNTPSARAYPESNSFYCFACGRTRDSIQLVREKEGVDLWTAVRLLEKRYGLPDLPWSQDVQSEETTLVAGLEGLLERQSSYTDTAARLHALLMRETKERSLPYPVALSLWEEYDRIQYGVEHESWEESRGKKAMLLLRQKLLKSLSS